MERPEGSPILEVGVRAVFHTALLFSVFLLLVGHDAPGGGFVGGLVAGAAFVLRFAAGGVEEVRAVIPFPPTALLGAGLVVAVVAGVGAWSPLVFDTGVYLIVIGLVLALVLSLGGAPDGGPV